MALNRIKGDDELYVGGVFGINRPRLIAEYKITHILSVIKYSLPTSSPPPITTTNRDVVGELPQQQQQQNSDVFKNVEHLSIDIDDMDDQDILVHLPRMVRFIDRGLNGNTTVQEEEEEEEEGKGNKKKKGAVVVHCAMGKSRSVTAVVAYLLWKYPHRFGGGGGGGARQGGRPSSSSSAAASEAVAKAVEWVRETRPIAEPNDGFMEQLAMWCEMGCPADSDDAVEREARYQRWLYKREVEMAAAVGRAPDWIRFEDEEEEKKKKRDNEKETGAQSSSTMDLRCKKCRRVLATEPFVVPHRGRGNDLEEKQGNCPHYFVEALSWMKGTLELGELEGRLNCPNTKCGGVVGRYSWRGFKCSCGEWVAPAFSLQKSKVDKVEAAGGGGGGGGGGGKPGGGGGGAADIANRMAALGIRMPPGQRNQMGVEKSGNKRQENL